MSKNILAVSSNPTFVLPYGNPKRNLRNQDHSPRTVYKYKNPGSAFIIEKVSIRTLAQAIYPLDRRGLPLSPYHGHNLHLPRSF